jgi:hypothetical protein
VIRLRIPEAVLTAAHDRARARSEGDWVAADELRLTIEAAGWKIVDRGTDFALSPMIPSDQVDAAGRIVHGSSANVPSRLEESAVGVATVVLVAGTRPEDLPRTLEGLRRQASSGTSVVVVAGPGDDVDVGEGELDVVRLGEDLGRAAALNSGIRRATAPLVIVLDPSIELTGDPVGPLADAMGDLSVAIAGATGWTSGDLRRFDRAPAGDVDIVDGRCQVFRRSDYIELGPLDERIGSPQALDAWWSLVLRDGRAGEPSRRAVSLDGLPITDLTDGQSAGRSAGEPKRLAKRDFYRVFDRFGSRTDLLSTRSTPDDPA